MIASAKKGRGRFNSYTREKKAITEAISETLLQYAPLPKFKNCRVGFAWIEPNKRRDKDNISAGKKYILDALVWCGVLENDGWSDISCFLEETFEIGTEAGVVVLLDSREDSEVD